MELKFKTQAHQTAAVQAVLDCFQGQPSSCAAVTRTSLKPGQPLVDVAGLDGAEGGKNAELLLAEASLLNNIQNVQRTHKLPLSPALVQTRAARLNLDIEMETGTGKTYGYIKTLFELNRRYGWSKFIIVTPSVAIREGVAKTLVSTATHFLASYHQRLRFFVYHSRQLQPLDGFATGAGIQVMVINVQAFNASDKEARRIYEDLDDFQSRRPIDVIAAQRPILILDEPQKMEGAKTLDALAHFQPLFLLRYSATHKTRHNLIYRLDAVDAYRQKLVKKIAVRGIAVKGQAACSAYLYLQSIVVSSQRPPLAHLEFERRLAQGGIQRHVGKLVAGDDLYQLSCGMEQYRNGFVVAEVDVHGNRLRFTNGLQLKAGDALGDVNELVLRRLQIREAIQAHLAKEQALFQQGVKALTLFFIDAVRKYRDYTQADEKGVYARIFEEEYRLALSEVLAQAQSPYRKYLDGIAVEQTHSGYFSIDKKSKRLADPALSARGANAGLADDVAAYELILRDKERLLSFAEPVRFIFSHSALREGWDNPNVFVIGTLKHSEHQVSRRQEVGRGLRLCVNQRGERVDHPDTVHEVNVLTVVASESYQDFVAALQKDFPSELSSRAHMANRAESSQLPEVVDDRKPRNNPLNANFEKPEFKALWRNIQRKASYRVHFDETEVVQKAVDALTRGLLVLPLQYSIQHGAQAAVGEPAGVQRGLLFEVKSTVIAPSQDYDFGGFRYDLIGQLAAGSQLTRRALVEILKGLKAETLAQFNVNPEAFIAAALRLINTAKASVCTDQLEYFALPQANPIEPCSAGQTLQDIGLAIPTPKHHIFDYLLPDSKPEREFVQALEDCAAVLAYAKWPRAFQIPTPVGAYQPDWAMVLQSSAQQPVCIVADTKAAFSARALSEMDLVMTACARKFFAALNRSLDQVHQLRFEVVESLEQLLRWVEYP